MERMQLRLEDIEQRIQVSQPKERDRLGDYAKETARMGSDRSGVSVIAAGGWIPRLKLRKTVKLNAPSPIIGSGWRGCNHDSKRSIRAPTVQSGVPPEPLLAADGTHLTYCTKRWAKLEISNQVLTHPVVIVENVVQQVLLG
ncbi:hypothetical protein T11_12169 [Trichinella zimbabwensis]|uniref:Uncharacterized protein n=1 Tax=Trichinella zimbabwensis TaxID=268475 RepID=A0A0V1HJL1_9BILA|nr:hypothetical protein T11_12169 [Trichinella zimbabwensis]